MHNNFSNPAIIGPGVWYSIHLKAKHATTFEKKQEFVEYMEQLSREFPCMECRNHIKEYLDNNPFDIFFQMINKQQQDIGMFKWSWLFHNAVNTRLGKPYVDWETAWGMYDTEDSICNLDCGNSGVNSEGVNNSGIDNNLVVDKNNNKNEYNSEEDITITGFNKQRSVNPNKVHHTEKGSNNKDMIIQSYFMNKGISQVLGKLNY